MTREESLKILRDVHDKALFSVRNALETLIPELRESEDERTRKGLIEALKASKTVGELKFILPEPTREECIAYLEKQKEQKPNVEICPHSIKSKSYKENGCPIEDCDYGLEIAYDILKKTFGEVRGYQTDDGIREHQTAIKAVRKAKEQKPAEIDEEHKVGKWFTGLIPCWIDAPSTLQPAHRYHGKNVIAIHLKDGGYRCCCVDDKKPITFCVAEDTHLVEGWKDRKPAEWKPQSEALEALMYAIEGRWEMIKPTSYLSRRLEDLYEGLVNNFDVDETLIVDKDLEELKALKAEIEASMEQKSAEKQDYSGLSELERAIHRGFLAAGVENVPVGIIKETAKECLTQMNPAECIKTEELAEHIKAEFESFRNLLKKKGIDYQPAETYWTDFARLFVSSAKKLQKPAEWGEDDQLIGFIFDLLNDLVWRKDFAMSKEECLERLKSLRPQPKQEWSHDDTQHRNKILLDLRNRQARYAEDKRKNWKDADFYDCCMKDNGENIEWLESLPKRFNLRPSWKPSEEQMEALKKAVNKLANSDVADSVRLSIMYDNLKKLI